MCLNSVTVKKVKGFSLIAALFVIVILGLLAAALYRMTQTANVGVAQEVLSIRAFLAAESGAQTAAMEAFPLGGAGVCNSRTINFSSNGLVNCSVNITCSAFASAGETYYQIESQGQCSTGDLQASRTLEVMLRPL